MNDSVPDPPDLPSMSSSLLEGLRRQDAVAWRRVVRLFHPLVRAWCRRAGLQDEDAADVSQEVFRALTGNLDRFTRAEGHTFRGWLHGITRRQLLAHWRRQKREPVGDGGDDAWRRFAEVTGPDGGPSDDPHGPADRLVVLRQAVLLLRDAVEERTWEAFWRTAVEGQPPAGVAADLGVSVNSVYLARARLLKRLREEFGDLLE